MIFHKWYCLPEANKKDDVNIETLTNYFNPSDHVDNNSSAYNNDNKLKQQNSTQTLRVEGKSDSVSNDNVKGERI